jgi:hypothetical protein
VQLCPGEVLPGFGERWNEVRMFRARERNHSEAVRKGRKMLLQFMRWPAGGDEVNFIEIKAAVRGARDSKMSIVYGIERAAKQSDAARMMFCGRAVRLRGGQ